MEEIASHGEIGRSTIYKHFRDKDEILSAIADYFAPRLVALVETLPGPDPTSTQISDWLEDLTAFLAQHRTASVLLTELGGSAHPHPAIPALGATLLRALAARLPAFEGAISGQQKDGISYARAKMLLRDIGWSAMQCMLHKGQGFGRDTLIVVSERMAQFIHQGSERAG